MKKNTIILLCLAVRISFSQSYINTVWQQTVATPSNYDKVSSVISSSGELITNSNNLLGTATQIFLNCRHSNGSVLWQQNTTGSSSNNNYGADIAKDLAGNLYTCDAYHSGTNYNYRVAKYLPNGTLVWQQFYNGTGNGDDIPTAIKLDNLGNIYVTGSSYGIGSFPDYLTIKYNNSGSVIFTSRYNFANLPDLATDLLVDNLGNVFVTGSSASSLSNADITTIKYDGTSGNQLAIYRNTFAGNGLDLAAEMNFDNSGNLIITGSFDNGTKKFGTLKLSNILTSLWLNFISGSNLSEGYSVVTDNSNNIISVGYENNNSGGSDILVNKYSSTGALLWQRRFQNTNQANFAKARKVKTDLTGNIYVASDAQESTTKDFLTLSLNANGVLRWSKAYNSQTNGSDTPYDLELLNNDVVVTGITSNGSSKTISSVKYSAFERNQPIIYNGSTPIRYQNEILVRFHLSALNYPILNDKKITQGMLVDFLTPQALSELNLVLKTKVENYNCYKVFPNMVMADSMSISREGNTIQTINHFATLGILLPTSSNDSITLSGFMSAKNVVNYGDYNHIEILHVGSNDPEYTNGNTAALVTTTAITSANINIEPAWDINTGNSNVKVGVFDSGINLTHQDFGNGSLGMSSSKIVGGYNYYTGAILNANTTNDLIGHGTAVADIIGALRNNSFGISGIAGGDLGNLNNGVSLYDMAIFQGNTGSCTNPTFYAGDNAVLNAIVEGASSNTVTSFGFGQHVQNHSWGGTAYMGLILDAFTTAFQNKVVLSVSSGNNGSFYNCNSGSFQHSYPASYKDQMVMKVGANDATGFKTSFSECGYNLDFIAPGVNSLYTSLDKNTTTGLTDFLTWNPGCSANIDGTSFAAPHASGTSALLISYAKNTTGLPNVFYPEDCERLMEYNITDLTGPTNYSVGYDNNSGYGRINAGLALQGVKYPDYVVKHFSFTVPASSATQVGTHEISCLRTNTFSLPAGYVYVNRWKINGSTSHSIPPLHTFIKGWELCSGSNLTAINSDTVYPLCAFNSFITDDTTFIPDATKIYKNSITATSASFTGYTYEILDNSFNTVGWFPINLSTNATFAYSIYYKKNGVGINENSFTEHSISVFPNPTSGKLYIRNNLEVIDKISITIINNLGQEVFTRDNFDLSNTSYVDISNLSSGIYFANLKYGNKTLVKKIVLTN